MCQDCEKQRKAPPSASATAKSGGTSELSSDQAGDTTPLQVAQKVEGLTINNYGHISFFNDKPVLGVPGPLTFGETDAMRELLGRSPQAVDKYSNLLGGTSQSTDRTASIGIENNLPVTLSYVTLEHQYSDWEPEIKTWQGVKANTSTAANFKASYQTGRFRWDCNRTLLIHTLGASGTDHWRLTITFEDEAGGAVFSTSWKNCMMKASDDSQYGPMWFQIIKDIFNINLRSVSHCA